MKRREKKVRERSVTVEPDRDGMAWLTAYLPAEAAYGIAHRIDATARNLQSPDEQRTLSQLRADVLADLLTHTCTTDPTAVPGPSSEGYRGISARVFVTVPVMTLLGGDEPADLDGYGPIDAPTARVLAAHAPSFTRLLTHPETGAVLSVGRRRYKPPKDLQDWVRVRDKTCRHPGCNRVAARCEIDHTTPWSQGGQTCAANLAAFCRKHHMFKTMGFWRHRQPAEGVIRSLSFAGRTYTTLSEPSGSRPQMPPPF